MLFAPHGRIGRFMHRRTLARWKTAADHVQQMPLGALETQSRMAHQVLRDARKFKVAADDRLRLPRRGSDSFAKPPGTDWSWRPQVWGSAVPDGGIAPARAKDSLTNEVVIFHDCKASEISLTQSRNMREIDLSAYSLD